MSEVFDLVVIGAGPAGLSAATVAAEVGLSVCVIDDQKQPGGQIYRAVNEASPQQFEVLGRDYAQGRDLTKSLEHARVTHLSGGSVWELTRSRQVFYSRTDAGHVLEGRRVIIATGALERAMPFPGWTLPGVMTAGAGQILLKTAGLCPREPFVLAGCGPLLVLLATQYLDAGATIAALVETPADGCSMAALRHLPGALRANEYLRKGAAMLARIRRAKVPHYRTARNLEAVGTERVEALRFDTRRERREIPCSLLMLHLGVVPNVQITRSLGIQHDWKDEQRCWRPRIDEWGQTEIDGISVAGDGGGIMGAEAASSHGRIVALKAAERLGKIGHGECSQRATPERKALRHHLAVRPFLDRLYAPPSEFLRPQDATLVCRCEEVTAGAVRDFVRLGCLGPNQTKSFGRPGMGPCQGRYCGLTVSEIIAAERNVPVSEVGYYRIRPPIKPVTLGELASLELPEDADAIA